MTDVDYPTEILLSRLCTRILRLRPVIKTTGTAAKVVEGRYKVTGQWIDSKFIIEITREN